MSITLAGAIKAYLEMGQVEGKSSDTIIWYRKKLRDLRRFMESRSEGQILVSDLTLQDGRAFIAHLMNRKTRYPDHPFHEESEGELASSTINGYARAIRAFSNWLHEEGYIEESVFQRLKPPKISRTLIQPMTENELRKVFLAIPQHNPEGARNFAMVTLFCDSGVRLSEMVTLKLSDMDFSMGEFKVFGKGREERFVPFGLEARRAVTRYVEHFRPEPMNPADDRLFLTTTGRPLTRNSISKIVQRIARRSGIERLHPHLFRHTFAVRYLFNGGDVFSLQKILGHKSLEMTRRYVELANTDVREKHRKYSPVDNLGIGQKGPGRPRRRP